MLIRIDPTRDTALFAQIAASVRNEIASGTVAEGERLPAAKDVAASLGINVHTVLRAYQELRDEGLIELRRGRGATVSAVAPGLADVHADAAALVAKARASGLSPEALASLITEVSHER